MAGICSLLHTNLLSSCGCLHGAPDEARQKQQQPQGGWSRCGHLPVLQCVPDTASRGPGNARGSQAGAARANRQAHSTCLCSRPTATAVHNVEKLEPSPAAGGKGKWCSPFGKQAGNSFRAMTSHGHSSPRCSRAIKTCLHKKPH